MAVSVQRKMLVPLLTLILLSQNSLAVEKNGFDLTDSLIPASKIEKGGPPKDGIPSLDEPSFINAGEASFLDDGDRVIGVNRNGIAKAYPIKILNWHEVVNDQFGSEGILISYCPLCYTGMVFSVQGDDLHFTFGVSGLLYNSDVLLYDRQTGSLWSQLLSKAISGPLKNVTLDLIPSSHTTWREWKSRYPETLVLSKETGFKRNYERSPYFGYEKSSRLFFSVENRNSAYRNKELVLGISINGNQKAYPFAELSKQASTRLVDEWAGEILTIEWNESERTARVLDEKGNEIPSVIAYWFAWYAFHPDTEIFTSNITEQ